MSRTLPCPHCHEQLLGTESDFDNQREVKCTCGACGRPFLAVVSQQPPFNVAFVPDTESARLEAHGYYAEYES